MSARRRRRRRVGSSVDKWRNEMWFELRAPDYMGDQNLGHTPSSDIPEVVGRSVKISMMDLTNNFSDLNYHLTFKVTKISGKRAHTEFYGQELSRDFRRSQIRNHRSQVDGVFNLTLSDKSRVRVTVFTVTPVRAAHNTKKEIRKAIRLKIEEMAKELTFPAFVNRLTSYELRDELLPAAEEIFPIKLLEISKVKVLRLPADRQMQDVSELKAMDLEEEDEEEEEEEDEVELEGSTEEESEEEE